MIQPRSIVKIADNSGGKIGRVFKVLGSSKKRYARIGEVVVISVQKAEPRKTTKTKSLLYAILGKQNAPARRQDGAHMRFDENAVVIVMKDKPEPVAGRIFGPIPREIGEVGYQKIISLAPEVV